MITRRKWAWVWIVSTLLAASAPSARAQDEAPLPSASDVTAANAADTNAMAGAGPAAETPSAVPSSNGSGYSAFKIIADRNIFNGNRSGQVIRSTRSGSQQRSVRVDSFALVGTMVSEKGPMAFFDGTESSYRKPVRTGDSIAGFKIQEILHVGVRLALGTNTLDLKVGSGMRREDEGLWKPSSGGMTFASGGASESSSRSSSYSSRSGGGSSRDRSPSSRNESRDESSGGDTASSADVDEVLKRLMEKREKE